MRGRPSKAFLEALARSDRERARERWRVTLLNESLQQLEVLWRNVAIAGALCQAYEEGWPKRRGPPMTVACARCGYDPSLVVAISWEFHVPREVKSLNASSTNHGLRRFAYRDERKGWERDMLTMRCVHGIPLASTRRRVTLTRLMGPRQRPYDVDGLIGGAKKIADAMAKAGLIVGDSPKQVEIHYAQVKAERPGLRVLIEELEAT